MTKKMSGKNGSELFNPLFPDFGKALEASNTKAANKQKTCEVVGCSNFILSTKVVPYCYHHSIKFEKGLIEDDIPVELIEQARMAHSIFETTDFEDREKEREAFGLLKRLFLSSKKLSRPINESNNLVLSSTKTKELEELHLLAAKKRQMLIKASTYPVDLKIIKVDYQETSIHIEAVLNVNELQDAKRGYTDPTGVFLDRQFLIGTLERIFSKGQDVSMRLFIPSEDRKVPKFRKRKS